MTWWKTLGIFYTGIFFGIVIAALMQAAKSGDGTD